MKLRIAKKVFDSFFSRDARRYRNDTMAKAISIMNRRVLSAAGIHVGPIEYTDMSLFQTPQDGQEKA